MYNQYGNNSSKVIEKYKQDTKLSLEGVIILARKSSFMVQMAREAARQARINEAERKRQERERIRLLKEQQRQQIQFEKEEKMLYIESRIKETEDLNYDLKEQIHHLNIILDQSLQVNNIISFASLKSKKKFKSFSVPNEITVPTIEPAFESYSSQVKSRKFLQKIIPILEKRYQKAMLEAKEQFENDFASYEKLERERISKLNTLKAKYEKEKSEFEMEIKNNNLEIDEFERNYRNGESEAVIAYNNIVLERSKYLAEFPQQFRLAYLPNSKELVIDYEIPNKDIVPPVAEYKYIKTRDEISEKLRKDQEIKNIYSDVVASIALRTLYEIFDADQANNIDVIVFSGYVHSIDPATGKDIAPYLISTRVVKEVFKELDLNRVEKSVCLRNLGAQVSPRPAELQAVKPILEFNMVDKRFVDHESMLDSLQSLPNLMDLNPYEFEKLVTDLFARMGLDAKLTRSSKDGGVDCVAFDTRPIVGGKVVIQAKRYKNTVGVSSVRDLYGTMMNEGANKGILVTTKSYGPDAYEFAKDKPIELIDGGGLLYLLEQNGIKARIIFEQ
ncbi:restriction endonuclease [Paenibacillus bovis]|uniref:restriction endonuclease n=1 Tax=Paenibacillus bovis TaxID=1616788 RepID=UPI001D130E17|nr:restriction endonuclease [Paenibacillus bovis]